MGVSRFLGERAIGLPPKFTPMVLRHLLKEKTTLCVPLEIGRITLPYRYLLKRTGTVASLAMDIGARAPSSFGNYVHFTTSARLTVRRPTNFENYQRKTSNYYYIFVYLARITLKLAYAN